MKKQIIIFALQILFMPSLAMANMKLGLGVYDITGPAAQLGMLGYGKLDQVSSGIHQRLRARAFIIEGNNHKRIAFVNTDLPMVTQSIHQGVLKVLSTEMPQYSYNNVMLSATHTHSGPGGYSHDALYNMTTEGFNQANYKVIITGIVEAIRRADSNMDDGHLYYGQTHLVDASKNRSIDSYDNNPQADLANYSFPFRTQMDLFKFTDSSDQPIGMLNWFALHGVSMSNRNHLISGDNKGYAEYQFEKDYGTDYKKVKTFVAAFAQADEGDVSPNIHQVEDDPTANDFDRTKEEGEKQYLAAKAAFENAGELIDDDVDYRFAYINMPREVIGQQFSTNGKTVTTCDAALGYAFAAGTSDGRGVGLFHEGNLNHLPIIDALTSILVKPSKQLTQCQLPKPILLATGQIKPIPWTANILPIQLFRVGRFVIAGVPGEFTTMSGRYLRQTLAEYFPADTEILIAGLSNAYSGYITTGKEYEVQNYEGGHTLFGPHTLSAYLQEFARIASDMQSGRASELGQLPADLSGKQVSLQPPVLFDDVPLGKHFGDVKAQAKARYSFGDTVKVSFWGAHPNNHLMTQESYLYVEKQTAKGWQTVAEDWDWSTVFHWRRVGVAYSQIDATWHLPNDIAKGQYRIRHVGYYKTLLGAIKPYEGVSRVFSVV